MEIRRTFSPAVTLSANPCPFCNYPPEKAVLVEIHRCEGMSVRTLHQVACACGATGPARASLVDAARAWSDAGLFEERAKHLSAVAAGGVP